MSSAFDIKSARLYINSLLSSELKPAKVKGTYVCPLCGNGTGDDGDGIISPDGGKHWKCFRCGFYGDYLDYLKKLHRCGENAVFSIYCLFGRPSSIPPPAPDAIRPSLPSPPPYLFTNYSPAKDASYSFSLYTHSRAGEYRNTRYPKEAAITSLASFSKAVSYDHVCCRFKDSVRRSSNFISSDCIMMDVDNDSDDPASWKSPEDAAAYFSDVPFYSCFSKSNMKEKNGKPPRPRFHVYFPMPEITDAAFYVSVKKLLSFLFPSFDTAATDASRFFAGIGNPSVSFHPGSTCLLYFLSKLSF